jgi:hypothetical protein
LTLTKSFCGQQIGIITPNLISVPVVGTPTAIAAACDERDLSAKVPQVMHRPFWAYRGSIGGSDAEYFDL